MNILVAVPSMDEVPVNFAQALAMLQKVDNTAIAFQTGSLVYTSRNELAKTAIKMEADYVLWLDSDMVFEPTLLKDMLNTMKENDIDFLTGAYFKRVEPYSPVLYDKLRVEGNFCDFHALEDVPNELFTVEGCGFGCVLMSLDVIISVLGKFAQSFQPLNGMGEDLSFCYRARECGYEIWCDPGIRLGHVAKTIVTREFFEAFRGSKNG